MTERMISPASLVHFSYKSIRLFKMNENEKSGIFNVYT